MDLDDLMKYEKPNLDEYEAENAMLRYSARPYNSIIDQGYSNNYRRGI